MRVTLCGRCGGPMDFQGSMARGGMRCPHCDEPKAPQPTPEEIDENIKALNAGATPADLEGDGA